MECQFGKFALDPSTNAGHMQNLLGFIVFTMEIWNIFILFKQEARSGKHKTKFILRLTQIILGFIHEHFGKWS